MIVPMKKVSFVLLEEHRKDALKKLRRLGVVHLEKVTGASQELSEYKDSFAKAELAYSILSEIKLPMPARSSMVLTFSLSSGTMMYCWATV